MKLKHFENLFTAFFNTEIFPIYGISYITTLDDII